MPNGPFPSVALRYVVAVFDFDRVFVKTHYLERSAVQLFPRIPHSEIYDGAEGVDEWEIV